jgi:multidrug efflux pump
VLGFSINALSLFGLVLAIGIVVDDAIVVVENVERNIEGMRPQSPREATYKAMREVSGPIIAIALVLVRGVRAARLHHRPALASSTASSR